MSRIGFQRGSARRPNHSSPIVLSHEGGELYAITDPAQYLLSSACYLGEPGFYADRELSDPDNTEFSVLDERGRAIMKAARELALGPNPEDLLIIAHWARQSMNMRLFPQLLMTAAARWLKARSGEEQPICRYMPKVCSRPDDLLQVFALTNLLFGQPKSEKVGPRANFPQRLKKAMARTLSQYSLYKLVKYNRPQHHPNYADVLGVLRCRGLMRPSGRRTQVWLGGSASLLALVQGIEGLPH
jgi:hypothetical protein